LLHPQYQTFAIPIEALTLDPSSNGAFCPTTRQTLAFP
jgi:hypothetical protein